MPKPSRQQLHSFKLFERRQQIYERKYQKYILTYLSVSYKSVIPYLKDNFERVKDQLYNRQPLDFLDSVGSDRLDKILTKLYKEVIIKEAVIAYNEVIEPLEGNRLKTKTNEGKRFETKDFIDDIIGLLSPNSDKLIYLWRSLLNDYVEVRLTNKIKAISKYTNERITKIIQDGMNEGLGQDEVAKRIRDEARGNFNVNRSRMIARTETVVSANQGKFMAADSSRLVMKKKWMPTKDDRTRQSHIAMLDAPWIPLKNDFWLGTPLGFFEPGKYPGDDKLSAENVINCRCSMIFEPQRDASGSLIRKGSPGELTASLSEL